MKKSIIFNYNHQVIVTKVEFPEVCPLCFEEAIGYASGYEFDSDSKVLDVLIQCPSCEEFYHTFHSFNSTSRECVLLNTKIMKAKRK